MAMELRVSAGVHFRLPTDPTSIKAVACPGLCNYTCISVPSTSFAGLLGENNRLSCRLQEDEPPGAGAVSLLLNDGMRALTFSLLLGLSPLVLHFTWLVRGLRALARENAIL